MLQTNSSRNYKLYYVVANVFKTFIQNKIRKIIFALVVMYCNYIITEKNYKLL